jgi:hypothetical protein
MDNSVYYKIKADMPNCKRIHIGIFNSIEKARANTMVDEYTPAEAKESLPSYVYKDFVAKKQNIDYLIKCDKDLATAFSKVEEINFDKVLQN